MSNKKESNKEKGNFLETICCLFEKSLDYPSVKITKNYKLELENRPEREIDIFIEYQVGKRKHQIAIECKNHKKNISMKEINDFHSKIEHTNIEGYFVTSSYYQKGALQEAKRKGLKLYKLSKNIDKGGDAIKDILLFKNCDSISQIRMMINKEWNNFDDFTVSLKNCPNCVPSLFHLLSTTILPNYKINVINNIREYYPEYHAVNTIDKYIGEENAKELSIMFELSGCKIQHDNQVYNIDYFRLNFKIWHEFSIIDNDFSFTYDLIEIDFNKSIGTISPIKFKIGNKNIISTLNKFEDSQSKICIADYDNIDNSHVHDAHPISMDNLALKQKIDEYRSKNSG